MKRTLLLLLTAVVSVLTASATTVIPSPDGRTQVTVDVTDGHVFYSIALDGVQMLCPSALGLRTNIGDFSAGLKLMGVESKDIEKHYEMAQTKASHADFTARQTTLTFENAKHHRMSIEFTVANGDVAFRYLLHRQENDNPKSAVVYAEASSFRLPSEATAFVSPQATPMIGWERTKPSYEEVYSADAPLTATSQYGQGYVFPALFRIGDHGWMLISETGVGSNYCGAHLNDYDPARGYTIAYPQQGENNGIGSASAGIPVPGYTPYRTITLDRTPKHIVETTIAYDLVEPLYAPSQPFKPGRYTWSWLIWQDESINYADQVKFVDTAAAMGFEYCLVDNWWDQRIGRDSIALLSQYAQRQGVKLMLWYNSNGYENDAPQTPRQRMNTAIARDEEMRWMQSIGIAGIKVDFFGGDKQQTMALYEDILADANRYGLQVIFHGCTLPRGWERMYPNYVASEAVLASENVFFTEEHARRQPFDLTLHPFCRNATASMDWGGIILNKRMSPDNRSRHARQTTDIFELASGITMQTAVQCVAIQPNNLEELPDFELNFLKKLPTTWDETVFIDGYPGRYVILARRTGSQWYVAGLNAEAKAKTLTLSLPQLAGKPVAYYYDDAKRGPQLKNASVGTDGRIKVTIQPNGGILLTN